MFTLLPLKISASIDLGWYGLTTPRHDGKVSIQFPDISNFSKEWLIDSLPWNAVTWNGSGKVNRKLVDAIIRGPLDELDVDQSNSGVRSMTLVFLYMYLITNRVNKERYDYFPSKPP